MYGNVWQTDHKICKRKLPESTRISGALPYRVIFTFRLIVKLGSEQFSHLGRVRKGMSIKNLPDFTILGSLQLAYPYHMLYNVRDKMILKYIPKPDKIAFSEVIGSKPSSGFLLII
uniref:Uncharacterized protein n=1 Tax=Cacopsylla melanoneura TaxID=428564 RepID=A0A8D9AWR8_9HEMI